MNPQSISRNDVSKGLFLLSLFCLISFLFIKSVQISSIAQSEERVLEDTIPKHVPIKVKIKKEKEKSFKDLKNDKWVRDLEIELTNTGDKPIYFLSLILVLPEIVGTTGYNVGFALHYGRPELGDIITKAGPDDIPIKPGETYTFKIAQSLVRGWESESREQKWQPPKKVILHINMLSFGGGTGFFGNDGQPFPRGAQGIQA